MQAVKENNMEHFMDEGHTLINHMCLSHADADKVGKREV